MYDISAFSAKNSDPSIPSVSIGKFLETTWNFTGCPKISMSVVPNVVICPSVMPLILILSFRLHNVFPSNAQILIILGCAPVSIIKLVGLIKDFDSRTTEGTVAVSLSRIVATLMLPPAVSRV